VQTNIAQERAEQDGYTLQCDVPRGAEMLALLRSQSDVSVHDGGVHFGEALAH
jgi:hypothetical protein